MSCICLTILSVFHHEINKLYCFIFMIHFMRYNMIMLPFWKMPFKHSLSTIYLELTNQFSNYIFILPKYLYCLNRLHLVFRTQFYQYEKIPSIFMWTSKLKGFV